VSLTDKIKALADIDGTVPLAEVLELVDKTVKIEIDPELHKNRPEPNEQERRIWETLDTAWNLLREGALHAVIFAVRSSLEEVGAEVLTGEQIFESLKDNPDAPRNYREVAPASPIAQSMVSAAFQILMQESMDVAAESLGLEPTDDQH
jgi:hypothetical protein